MGLPASENHFKHDQKPGSVKYYLTTTLIVLLTQMSAFGQEEFKAYRVMHMDSATDQYYDGGSRQFLELMYHNIKYPHAAREQCRIGKLMTEVYISPESKIVRIEFKNPLPLGFGLEDAVISVIALSASHWKTEGEGIIVPVVFSFSIELKENLKGDINVIAYSTAPDSSCPVSRSSLEADLKRLEKREKWEKAVSVCEELVRRYPEESKYFEKFTKYSERLDK